MRIDMYVGGRTEAEKDHDGELLGKLMNDDIDLLEFVESASDPMRDNYMAQPEAKTAIEALRAEKKTVKRRANRAATMSHDDKHRHASRVIGALANLTLSEQRRVLAHAEKMLRVSK